MVKDILEMSECVTFAHTDQDVLFYILQQPFLGLIYVTKPSTNTNISLRFLSMCNLQIGYVYLYYRACIITELLPVLLHENFCRKCGEILSLKFSRSLVDLPMFPQDSLFILFENEDLFHVLFKQSG